MKNKSKNAKTAIILWIIAGIAALCGIYMLTVNAKDSIFYFVACVILGAVGVGFYLADKKQAAPEFREEQPQPQSIQEPPAEEESPYEFLKTKIAGVTFSDGHKQRQTILRRLYWKDEPFDKNEAELELQREEFEGEPAFAVIINGRKAGYVPKENVQYIVDNYSRCDGIVNIRAYHGKNDIYGAEITIRFRRP